MTRLFGTDGVRGVANSELTPELVFNLGRAGAYVLTKENKYTPKILIGLDTRISGDMLESALTSGMCSVGAVVYYAGVIPTPGVAFLIKKYGLDAGVMISASHNPFGDNGIKFFNSDGYKLPDLMEDEIEEVIRSGLDKLPKPEGIGVGYRRLCENALDDYWEFLKSTIDVRFDNLRVAIDCANGATYSIAPKVFAELGAEVFPINNTPDGININNCCGSTHMESLVEFVKQNKADIGLAFDGDGDRFLAVDENGKVVEGDEILAMLALNMKECGKLVNDTIVSTVMSNIGLSLLCNGNQINIETTKVGDRYVLEKMIDGGFNIGGEQSGHVILLDFNTTGDGILTALQLTAIMRRKDKKLSELNTMEVFPQVIVNAFVKNEKKYTYLEVESIKNELNLLEAKQAGNGRVLIRPSGTEPVIRVMLEGDDKPALLEAARSLASLIEKELG